MLKIVKDDLKLKLNKKQKVYGLIEAQKAARIQKCRQFLAWHASDHIIFKKQKTGIAERNPQPTVQTDLSVLLRNIPREKLVVWICVRDHGIGMPSRRKTSCPGSGVKINIDKTIDSKCPELVWRR
jgi:hypothetical protein